MSYAVTNACRPAQMPPTPKNVLMAIADRADDAGTAWPSIPGLCEATCYSRTAVIEAVKWLESAGYVSVAKSTGRSNRFSVNLDRLAQAASAARRPGVRPPFSPAQPTAPVRQPDPSATRTSPADGPVRETDPTRPAAGPPPVREADYTRPAAGPEPSITIIQPPEDITAASALPAGFDLFWTAYPRKVAKPAARKAFAKLKPSSAVVTAMVQAVADQGLAARHSKGDDKFIPHPATWLNDRRWEDESPAVDAAPICPDWAQRAGFNNQFEARNEGCYHHNASDFQGGKRIEVPA